MAGLQPQVNTMKSQGVHIDYHARVVAHQGELETLRLIGCETLQFHIVTTFTDTDTPALMVPE